MSPNINNSDTTIITPVCTVTAWTNDTPAVGTVTMDTIAGMLLAGYRSYTLTATFSDPNGCADIDTVCVLVNANSTYVAGDSCAYLMFDENNSRFYLRNSADTAWLYCGDTAGIAATANDVVTVDSGCAVLRSGNELTVTWRLRPSFAWDDAGCGLWLEVTDLGKRYRIGQVLEVGGGGIFH